MYTELQVTTNFSFLRGGSHPEEIVEQAAALGYTAIAITDHNTLAGIVRAHKAAKEKGIRLIPACRLNPLDGPSLLAYPTDKAAYERLSSLLTKGNADAEKGQCHLSKTDIYKYASGMKFIVVPPSSLDTNFEFDSSFKTTLEEYKHHLGKNLYLGAVRSYQANDNKKLFLLSQLSQTLNIPMVAMNDVHYHHPERRELQDVLTCIREKCTIQNAGFRLYPNAERYLKPMEEMKRLFRQYPDAIARTQEIADACQFSLSSLKYIYPEEITTEDRTPQEELEHLTWKGAEERFNNAIPDKVKTQILFELEFIERKNYAAYFLTVHDFVRYARGKDILCQGRGSAANSVICYCLGITSVDPSKFNLLFARFMSDARDEPPDIDVDFEHERREEVIQYIYEKYGRDRAAIVATVTQERSKGAIRDVGKAMGLSVDTINHISGSIWSSYHEEGFDRQHIIDSGLNPDDPHLRKVLQLTEQLIGFPRQLGQHTGGFVITQGKISDLCPVLNARMENRTCIEWNKDDIEALGFLKVDVLALGMLTCIKKTFNLVKKHYDKDLDMAKINATEDDNVYDMICKADTIGVFQIESRAQMSMLPRLKPKEFYDLVIEVAIVRPGPIQGDMVQPYLKRRNGEEEITYPKPELEAILGRTKGVPLFQEQAMEIAIVAADFTPAEADQLRRSMATFKAIGQVSQFEKKLVEGMTRRGYEEDFARRIFRQLEGFGSYGFPESHAVSFALLVYVSSYIKYYYPDAFACALLNSQPMGFYQPAQIILDAQKHNVTVKEADINYSYWDNTLEERSGDCHILRLGFRQINGFNEADAHLIVSARMAHFTNIQSLCDAGLAISAIERLADADAFRSIGLDRRQALWQVAALNSRHTGMYTGQAMEAAHDQHAQLPQMSLPEHVMHDYATTNLSLKAHPVSFVREKLSQLHILATKNLDEHKDGETVKVAGLILVRQRPGTASGICFITIEDETGIANLVVFQHLFEKYRKEILQSRLLMVEGKLQREGQVIHIVVNRCFNMTSLLHDLTIVKPEPETAGVQAAIQGEIFHKGRNFK